MTAATYFFDLEAEYGAWLESNYSTNQVVFERILCKL